MQLMPISDTAVLTFQFLFILQADTNIIAKYIFID